MIDLHVHLSGSISPRTVIELAREQGVYLPTYDTKELLRILREPRKDNNMEGMYERCDLADRVLQDPASIRRAVRELVVELERQGLLYAEIRYVPLASTYKGLTQEQAVKAAIEGLNQGIERCRRMKANLILSIRTDSDAQDCFKTIVEAKKYLRKGVAGIDFSSDESLYATDVYDWLFTLVKEENLPFTIHAGESSTEGIEKAILYGAKRIGQAVRVIDDDHLVEMIKERNILLEMCPTNNIQTHIFKSLSEHPVRRVFDAGIKVCVGADHMVVFLMPVLKYASVQIIW